MSKITFRAGEDLIEQLEAYDASKSEVMREALRSYLEGEADRGGEERDPVAQDLDARSLEDMLTDRVNALVDARLEEQRSGRAQDVNVNVTLDGPGTVTTPAEAAPTAADESAGSGGAREDGRSRKTTAENRHEGAVTHRSCGQCGEELSGDHVYCPNCGEKAARRVFCDCGDELRSDWGFCPSCGRRTPAADVLDQT